MLLRAESIRQTHSAAYTHLQHACRHCQCIAASIYNVQLTTGRARRVHPQVASHARGCLGGEQVGAVLQVPGERVTNLRQHEHQVHLHAGAAQL